MFLLKSVFSKFWYRGFSKNKKWFSFHFLIILPLIGGLLYSFQTRSALGDEFGAIWLAGQNSASFIIEKVRESDIHPPTHYLFLHYWGILLGYDDFAIRIPSLVFALFSIILIWKLIGEITQGRTGEEKRVIFLLCITTPFLWVLAGYARYYTLGMFLGLLSSYCYLLWVKEATPKNLFFTIIVTASLFYVHYLMAALVALGQGLHYLSGSKKRSARDVILWLTSQTIIIVLILPVLIWGIGPIISGSKDSLHNLAREGISGGKAIPMVLFGHIFTILTGAAPFPWDVWVTLPMTIATAGLVFHGIKGKGLLTSRESLCLAVIPLFLLTVMIPTLVPVTGYFMGVARAASLPMLVWISLGASYTTISSSFARKMVLSVMLLGNLYLITIYNLNVSSMTQTPPVKEIADYIRISSPEQSESTIVFSPFVHGWGEPLARYLPGYKVRS